MGVGNRSGRGKKQQEWRIQPSSCVHAGRSQRQGTVLSSTFSVQRRARTLPVSQTHSAPGVSSALCTQQGASLLMCTLVSGVFCPQGGKRQMRLGI